MTTDRLREPQVPEPKKTLEFFKTTFMDNDGRMIPIEIEYQWTPYWGLSAEKIVCDFDWDWAQEGNISKRELLEEVKELIREREKPVHITFY